MASSAEQQDSVRELNSRCQTVLARCRLTQIDRYRCMQRHRASSLNLFLTRDVVAFLHPDDNDSVLSSKEPCKLALGRINVIHHGGKIGTVVVEELFKSDLGEHVWLSNGKCHQIPQSSVMRVVEAKYSQRVDADRVKNPHANAEEVWEVFEETLHPW